MMNQVNLFVIIYFSVCSSFPQCIKKIYTICEKHDKALEFEHILYTSLKSAVCESRALGKTGAIPWKTGGSPNSPRIFTAAYRRRCTLQTEEDYSNTGQFLKDGVLVRGAGLVLARWLPAPNGDELRDPENGVFFNTEPLHEILEKSFVPDDALTPSSNIAAISRFLGVYILRIDYQAALAEAIN